MSAVGLGCNKNNVCAYLKSWLRAGKKQKQAIIKPGWNISYLSKLSKWKTPGKATDCQCTWGRRTWTSCFIGDVNNKMTAKVLSGFQLMLEHSKSLKSNYFRPIWPTLAMVKSVGWHLSRDLECKITFRPEGLSLLSLVTPIKSPMVCSELYVSFPAHICLDSSGQLNESVKSLHSQNGSDITSWEIP